MAIKIKKQLASQNVINKRTYGKGNPVNYITIHQTDNFNKGADAQAHANLQSNLNPRQASWHYSVDDKEIIQSFEDNIKCWHCTDGRGPGNSTSIGIEICVNSDGNYLKAIENAVKLVQHLLEKHNLTADKVVQHNHWYAKNCPSQIRKGREGITWNKFIEMVKDEKKQPVKEQPKQNVSVPETVKIKKGDTFWGLSKKYGISVKEIERLNPKAKATALQIGQVIRLKPQAVSTPKPQPKPSYIGKRVESKVNGLRFYNKPSWSDKDVVGTCNKGIGFPKILAKVKVGSAYQYKVQNSKGKVYYITASPVYVEVK